MNPNQTGDQPSSDTFPYEECSLSKPNQEAICWHYWILNSQIKLEISLTMILRVLCPNQAKKLCAETTES